METYPCTNCGRPTGFKRSLGFGTMFAVALTFGFWLLAIPFYPLRCTVCGLSRRMADPAGSLRARRAVLIPVAILGVIWVVVAMFEGSSRSSSSSRATTAVVPKPQAVTAETTPQVVSEVVPATAPEESPMPQVTAPEYANEYHRNEVGADEKYNGRRFAITGIVKEIRKDFMDRAYVELLAPGPLFGGIHAEFSDPHDASSLTPNSQVTLVCTGRGMSMEMPFLKECSVQPQTRTPAPAIAPSATTEEGGDAPPRRPATLETNAPGDLRRHYVDSTYGYQFDYPAGYSVVEQHDSPNAVLLEPPDHSVSLVAMGSVASDHTVAEAYALERGLIHAAPTYEAKGKTWVVFSWNDGGKAFYLKRFVGTGSQNTFIISFPEAQLAEDSFLPTMVEHSFRPGDLAEAR